MSASHLQGGNRRQQQRHTQTIKLLNYNTAHSKKSTITVGLKQM